MIYRSKMIWRPKKTRSPDSIVWNWMRMWKKLLMRKKGLRPSSPTVILNFHPTKATAKTWWGASAFRKGRCAISTAFVGTLVEQTTDHFTRRLRWKKANGPLFLRFLLFGPMDQLTANGPLFLRFLFFELPFRNSSRRWVCQKSLHGIG